MRFSKKGRIICAILICAVYLTSFSGFAENEVKVSDTGYKVIWDEDFEKSNSISDCVDGSAFEVSIVKAPDKDGKCMEFVMNSDSSIWPEFSVTFDEPVSSGTLYVGYDLMRTNKGRAYDAYLKTETSAWGNGLYVGTMCAGGTRTDISYYKDMHIDAISTALPAGGQIKANNWSHVDSWIDLDNRIATHYYDGVLIGTTGITDELTQIAKYRRPGNSSGSYGTGNEYLDNYKIIHFPEVGYELDIDGAQGIPEYLETPAMVSISTGRVGNNYFGQDEKLAVEIESIVDEKISGTLVVKVVDENGNSVADENRSVSVDGRGAVTEEVEMTLPYFGYYYVNAEFKAEGKKASEAETKIVRLREAEEQNQKLGYSAHSAWNYGTEEIVAKQELLAKAGFKYQRDSTFFHEFAPGDGTFGFTGINKTIQDAFNSTDIEMLQLIEGVEAAIGKPLPETPEEYKRFEDYVYNLALALKDTVTYYEVLNEKNLSPEEGGAERYTKMQKTAYEAIKRADPTSVVLGGATARVPVEQIEKFLQAGAGEYFDSFSCHPYTVENLPEVGRVSQGDGTAEDMVVRLRGLLDKYGLYDKGIEVSELSYSAGAGYATEIQQAAFGLRQYMMVRPHVGVFIWYNDQDKSTAVDLESNFGLMENWNAPVGTAYRAKPVLVSFSAFNSIVGNAENLGKTDVGDDDVWIYKFKRADGKDVLAVWSANNIEKSIALELGAESAELSDMYGNTKKLYAYNEKFNFDISGNITYLVGNFDKTVLHKSEFSAYQYTTDALSGESFDIKLNIPDADDVSIEAKCPDNVTATNAAKGIVSLSAGFSPAESENVTIDIKKEGRLVYSNKTAVKYIDPIEYSYSVKPYNQQRYQGVLKVTNRRDRNVSMKLTLTAPEALKGKTYSIAQLVPGNERTVKLNIPIECMDSNMLEITGILETSTAEGTDRMDISLSKEFGCLKYDPDKKPTIDGKLDKGEWYEFLPLNINQKSMANQMEWGGESDLSAEIYMMCDDDNLYVAADVKDDVFYDVSTPERVWSVDSLQLALAVERRIGAGSSELGLGTANGEATLQSYISQFIEGEMGNEGFKFSEDTLYSVKRYEEEKRTVYELQLPWTQIYAEPISIKTMKQLYFSILVNDHDGDAAGRGWMEYCGGIGTNKNPELFMELPIYKVK